MNKKIKHIVGPGLVNEYEVITRDGTEYLEGTSRCLTNGSALSEATFSNGSPEGEHRTYYSTGELYSIRRFSHGVPHGKAEYFYRNGTKKSEIPYQNGTIHGTVSLYYDSGKLKRQI